MESSVWTICIVQYISTVTISTPLSSALASCPGKCLSVQTNPLSLLYSTFYDLTKVQRVHITNYRAEESEPAEASSVKREVAEAKEIPICQTASLQLRQRLHSLTETIQQKLQQMAGFKSLQRASKVLRTSKLPDQSSSLPSISNTWLSNIFEEEVISQHGVRSKTAIGQCFNGHKVPNLSTSIHIKKMW